MRLGSDLAIGCDKAEVGAEDSGFSSPLKIEEASQERTNETIEDRSF